MTKAYSYDLRKRAVDIIKSGMNIKKAVKLLKIGKTSIYKWLAKDRLNESIEPKKNWQKGHSHKITDLEEFKKFAIENAHLTLSEMAKKHPTKPSLETIRKNLKLINFSKKKDLWIQRKI